mmetsp:Transcript_20794/g.57960  ORF Transcript_20794/g.57960 Transcript_20794/m.57960 type:complete len:263 (-) Transcript_20794:412-1200(-)
MARITQMTRTTRMQDTPARDTGMIAFLMPLFLKRLSGRPLLLLAFPNHEQHILIQLGGCCVRGRVRLCRSLHEVPDKGGTDTASLLIAPGLCAAAVHLLSRGILGIRACTLAACMLTTAVFCCFTLALLGRTALSNGSHGFSAVNLLHVEVALFLGSCHLCSHLLLMHRALVCNFLSQVIPFEVRQIFDAPQVIVVRAAALAPDALAVECKGGALGDPLVCELHPPLRKVLACVAAFALPDLPCPWVFWRTVHPQGFSVRGQ